MALIAGGGCFKPEVEWAMARITTLPDHLSDLSAAIAQTGAAPDDGLFQQNCSKLICVIKTLRVHLKPGAVGDLEATLPRRLASKRDAMQAAIDNQGPIVKSDVVEELVS